MSKFKAKDKRDDIEWEGEELTAVSGTRIDQDTGSGQAVVLKFFDFGANIEAFKQHKPTAQELFNSHLKGIETMLWKQGLKVFDDVAPRLMFSKSKLNYRFIVACVPDKGTLFRGETKTLTQLLTNDNQPNPV